MPILELTEYLAAAKALLDIFKGIKGELPKGPKADQTQEQIDRAEDALRAAEAQLAKELGYNLCQCTFPPQIMLSVGHHPKYDKEIFQCQSCKNQKPTEKYFVRLARDDALIAAQNDQENALI